MIHMIYDTYDMMWYIWYDIWYDIYLSTAIGLTPCGSGTAHIYMQTIYRTTQITKEQHNQQLIWKSAGRALSSSRIANKATSETAYQRDNNMIYIRRNSMFTGFRIC